MNQEIKWCECKNWCSGDKPDTKCKYFPIKEGDQVRYQINPTSKAHWRDDDLVPRETFGDKNN
jgi:hypothetical protein